MPDKTAQAIQKFRSIHGEKYNYSLINYITAKTKVQVICQKHGIFLITPNNHLSGYGCAKCAGKNISRTELIDKFNQIHNFAYNYTDTIIQPNVKLTILCPIHGTFLVTRNNHIKGHGCPQCGIIKRSTNQLLPLAEFIAKSQQEHGLLYDYSLVSYQGSHRKVTIICPKHGEFLVTPANHWSNGSGCPKCCRSNMSKGERKIANFLLQSNVHFETQKSFPNLYYTSKRCPLKYDFYLPSYNTLIEYDGEHHSRPVAFCKAHQININETFNQIKIKDQIKNSFAINNNINLLRISYADDVIQILKSYFT